MDENVTIGSMKQIVKDFCEARDWDQSKGFGYWNINRSQRAAGYIQISDRRADEGNDAGRNHTQPYRGRISRYTFLHSEVCADE